MEAARLANSGYISPPSGTERDTSLKMPPANTTEGTTQNSTNLQTKGASRSYFGSNCGQVVLSALDLNFNKLEEIFVRTNKPILDVGASASTLAIEGVFRHIPIFGTDGEFNKIRPGLLRNMEIAIAELAEPYIGVRDFPSGFKCDHIPITDWEECVRHGIRLVDSRMSECTASEILLPTGKRARDREFSYTLSHHAVPKYSESAETFLSKELPELLRVTNDRLHLFPLAFHFLPNQHIHVPGSEGRKNLERVAKENGFSLEVLPSPTFEGDPAKQPGLNMLGIFVRRNNLK